jgi:phosphate transport system substrate-binding protein
MNKIRKTAVTAAIAATLVVASFAVATSASAATTITGSGSVAMEPYIRAFITGYKKVDPSVTINYTANGGNAGVKDVQQKRSNFAGQARPPVAADQGTVYTKGFKDGMCIAVNPQNKVKNLTIQQVADIYTGTITNWSGIPGSGRTDTIAPFGRESNAGQYTFFLQAVLNNGTQAGNVTTVLGDGLVRSGVAGNPAGIGYIGLAWINKKLKSVKLNGVDCAKATVKNKKYPLNRFLYWVTPLVGTDPATAKFIRWTRFSAAAGKIIDKVGGVTVYNKVAKKKKAKKSAAASFSRALLGSN